MSLQEALAPIRERAGMSGRDDLAATFRTDAARVIHTEHCLERIHSEDCTFWHDDHVSAYAILAAGYQKIDTSDEAVERAAAALSAEYKPDWGTLPDWVRNQFREQARTVIAAIRR